MSRTFLILSGAPFGSTGGGQHPAQLARQIAARGEKVLFYQSMPQTVQPLGITVTSVSSAYYEEFWQRDPAPAYKYWRGFANRVWPLASEGWVVVCCPLPWFVAAADVLKRSGWRVAYWILDDWEAFQDIKYLNWYSSEREGLLISIADKVFATADVLKRKAEEWQRPVQVIPNGFDIQAFSDPEKCLQSLRPPAGTLKQVVYWGCLNGPWLDWGIIEGIARTRPEWGIHLIGSSPSKVIGLPNVVYYGSIPTHLLAHYHGDVGIIPFVEDALSNAVDPIKAYEYLACGMPVVSCRMPQLNGWTGTTQIHGGSVREWVNAIEYAQPLNASNFLRTRSWQERVRTFLDAVSA